MKKLATKKTKITADDIADMADAGKDISQFFRGKAVMMPPIQRVNLDLSQNMLNELDARARSLNISRQAVIKTLVQQGLDQHYLAQRAREVA
jgi:hypothetical protein